MLPLQAAAPPGDASASLPSDSHAVSVSSWLTYPPSPSVLASSSVANPSVSCSLHSALLYALYSCSVPSTGYFSPAPSLHCISYRSSVVLFLPLAYAAVFAVSIIFLFATPVFLYVSPLPSLFLPPDMIPLPPPSLGLLRLPHPPRTPPPLALAANIAHEEKYFDDQTGGGEAR